MKPLEERVKEFMESNNFEQTLLGNYSGHSMMLDADLATMIYRQSLEARKAGMIFARSRVLRRTEIPAGAKNPTRDATVILGENIADIITQDILELNRLLEES